MPMTFLPIQDSQQVVQYQRTCLSVVLETFSLRQVKFYVIRIFS